jgi:2-keto-4-pentenoate hydratase/2-oxohepta-3-ene-1,7-dioic acid hydratase in catechol pathway
MKVCSFEHKGAERVGILVTENRIADATVAYAGYLDSRGEQKAYELAHVLTPPSMIGIIEGGASSLVALQEALQFATTNPEARGPKGEIVFYSLEEVKLKAPVPRPPKILAPALNHKQVWSRTIRPPTPPHPVYFIKLSTSVTGPHDPIEIPDIGVVGSEIEIGAVVSRKGKNIPIEKAEEYVFGYTVHNDITGHGLRDKEEWIVMKSADGKESKLTYAGRYKCFDTFAPMGPWIVTPDEIGDVHNCAMEARLNKEPVQKGNTADMVFKFPYLISYFSAAHTLEPGDIISSGTCTFAPGWNLQNLDLRKIGGVLESEVAGIGTMRNPIKPI